LIGADQEIDGQIDRVRQIELRFKMTHPWLDGRYVCFINAIHHQLRENYVELTQICICPAISQSLKSHSAAIYLGIRNTICPYQLIALRNEIEFQLNEFDLPLVQIYVELK
jgi:hypothetical protein